MYQTETLKKFEFFQNLERFRPAPTGYALCIFLMVEVSIDKTHSFYQLHSFGVLSGL
jgi:hypothetical protein